MSKPGTLVIRIGTSEGNVMTQFGQEPERRRPDKNQGIDVDNDKTAHMVGLSALGDLYDLQAAMILHGGVPSRDRCARASSDLAVKINALSDHELRHPKVINEYAVAVARNDQRYLLAVVERAVAVFIAQNRQEGYLLPITHQEYVVFKELLDVLIRQQ